MDQPEMFVGIVLNYVLGGSMIPEYRIKLLEDLRDSPAPGQSDPKTSPLRAVFNELHNNSELFWQFLVTLRVLRMYPELNLAVDALVKLFGLTDEKMASMEQSVLDRYTSFQETSDKLSETVNACLKA